MRSDNPLIDMTMMRVRGVWTTNAAAFLLGAGLYASFIVFPQFAQLPTSTGFGFGASVVVSGLYLLPATIGMTILGLRAGAISARFGSRAALLGGIVFSTASFLLLAVAHEHPYELLIAASLLGVGIGLAFAALGNLIVQAVPSHQTGVASGMNTVMRTLGGALGGQLSATFIAENTANGLPDRDRLHRDLPDGHRLPRCSASSPACWCRRRGRPRRRRMQDSRRKARITPRAAVAQLARASACHAEGRGFESLQPLFLLQIDAFRSEGNLEPLLIPLDPWARLARTTLSVSALFGHECR